MENSEERNLIISKKLGGMNIINEVSSTLISFPPLVSILLLDHPLGI